MSKARVHPTVWVPCLMLLTAAGTWGLQRHLDGAGAESAALDRSTEGNSDEPAAAVLADLPQAGGPSASDRAVTGATGRVQRNEADEAAWADLGDALMQKARETADADYYRHAERAFRKALALNPKNLDATTGLAWVYAAATSSSCPSSRPKRPSPWIPTAPLPTACWGTLPWSWASMTPPSSTTRKCSTSARTFPRTAGGPCCSP